LAILICVSSTTLSWSFSRSARRRSSSWWLAISSHTHLRWSVPVAALASPVLLAVGVLAPRAFFSLMRLRSFSISTTLRRK
jgi:hypothetical protein